MEREREKAWPRASLPVHKQLRVIHLKKGSKQKNALQKQQHWFCFALQPWQLPRAHPRCHLSVGNTLCSLTGPIYSVQLQDNVRLLWGRGG